MKKTFSYYLLLTGQLLFVLLFSCLSVQIIFVSYLNAKNTSLAVRAFAYIILLSCFLGSVIFFSRKVKGLAKRSRLLVMGICLLWFFIQGLYIYSTYSLTGSDTYPVNWLAWNIAHDIESEMFYWYYFARYQNNIPLLAICSGFYSLVKGLFEFEDSWLILTIIAALLANLAIFWTVKLSYIICPKKNIFFPLICAILLIGLSEEGTIFYTDITTLWVIPCSMYLCVLAFDMDKNPKRNSIFAGMVLGIGGALKPQVLIVAVAILIVRGLTFIHCLCNKQKIQLRCFLHLFIALLVSYCFLSQASTAWYVSVLPEQYNGKTWMDQEKYPVLHWVNMGLNASSYGAYSVDDVVFTANISGIEAKNEALLESIQKRLQPLSVKELFLYENQKVCYALQNGSFGQGMVWKGTLLNNSSLAIKLQPYFVSIYPQWTAGIGLLVQIVYLFLLVLCLLAVCAYLLSRTWFEQKTVQTMAISLIGAVCFIVLLEQNMRYFYTMVPVLISLSSKAVELIGMKGLSEKNGV